MSWWFESLSSSGYVLGQVNFGVDAAAILGILLASGGGGFFALRSLRPELSREQDIVIAAIALLCGLILIFKGWELNQIHEFNQFLLTGVAVALAVETIRLRAATVEQAKRRAPTVDRKRRTSRVYRAELDEIEPYDYEEEEAAPRVNRRRLKGTAAARPSRDEYFDDGYNDDSGAPEEDWQDARPDARPVARSRRSSRPRPDRDTRDDRRRAPAQRDDRRDAWDDGYSYRDADRDDAPPQARRGRYRQEPEIDFGPEDRDWPDEDREPPSRRRDGRPPADDWQRPPARRDRDVPISPPPEERPPIPQVARQPKRSRPTEPPAPPVDRSATATYTSYEPLDEDYDLGDSEY